MDYAKPDKKTRFLQQTALWIVMHPHNNNGPEGDILYPWWTAETIRMSQKIREYTGWQPHKFTVLNDGKGCVDCLSHYPRLSTIEQFDSYINKHNINSIVYTGFSHGICILKESVFGMENIAKNYPNIKLYLKHDMTCIGPSASVGAWKSADELTRKIAEII